LILFLRGGHRKKLRKIYMEVLKIQFDEMRALGTLEDYLNECGFEMKDN